MTNEDAIREAMEERTPLKECLDSFSRLERANRSFDTRLNTTFELVTENNKGIGRIEGLILEQNSNHTSQLLSPKLQGAILVAIITAIGIIVASIIQVLF